MDNNKLTIEDRFMLMMCDFVIDMYAEVGFQEGAQIFDEPFAIADEIFKRRSDENNKER